MGFQDQINELSVVLRFIFSYLIPALPEIDILVSDTDSARRNRGAFLSLTAKSWDC